MDINNVRTILILSQMFDHDELQKLIQQSKAASRHFEDIAPIALPYTFFNHDNQFMNKREKLLVEAMEHILALGEIAQQINNLESSRKDQS